MVLRAPGWWDNSHRLLWGLLGLESPWPCRPLALPIPAGFGLGLLPPTGSLLPSPHIPLGSDLGRGRQRVQAQCLALGLLLVPPGGHHAGCRVATMERQLLSTPAARRALGSCLCSWGHKNSWDEFLAGSARLSSGRCRGSLRAARAAWLGDAGCPPPAPSPASGDVAASAAAGLYVPPPASGGGNHNSLGSGGLLEAPGPSRHSVGLSPRGAA